MLKELRKKAGFSQNELAEKISVLQNTISNWENGVSRPSLDVIPKLANVLGVTVEEVVKCFEKKEG